MTESPPVLIVAFNRPERLRDLIEHLRIVRPPSVYVAIDGPRAEVDSDVRNVRETRELVRAIDWPCQVHTLFQESNLGCGRGVSTAITWFFSQVEEGIILEDDVLPDPTFFPFCAELLDRYRLDPRVFAISGCNFAPKDALSQPQASYRFSAITHVWGWATWNRSWAHYRFSMARWRHELRGPRRWQAMGGDLGGYVYWSSVFDWMRFGRIDTWDYQLSFAQMAQGGLTATSNINLTENAGFTGDSTHTNYVPPYVQASQPMVFPLIHAEVQRDLKADRWVRKQILAATTASIGTMARNNLVERGAAVASAVRRVGIEGRD